MVSYMTDSPATKIVRPLSMIYTLFGMLVSALLLASCGGGAGTVGTPTGKSLYTTSPNMVNIAVGSSVSFEIGGGTATYKASSSNANVASVEAKGTTLTIKGVLNGTAQIVISDAAGAQVGINVTVASGNTNVNLFVTAPSVLTIAPGLSSSYVIGGGAPGYFVSSSNTSVATVGINGNNFFISGIKTGNAQIIVVDGAGTAVTLTVTVGTGGVLTPLYVTAAATINSTIGEVNDYVVGGGIGPYLVSSSNKSVATVTLTGNIVSVKGLTKGSAQIMVFDGTGESLSTTVVVDTTGTAIPLYIASASAVTMEPGAKATYPVGGGSAPYIATSSNTSVAKAEISNNILSVSAVSAGVAQILVFDASGISASITLTVGSGAGSSTALFTTAGTGVVMPKGTSNTYSIGGGKAPYKATSSNSGVVTVPASISGNEFTISSIAVGSSQVSIFDATGASVSFSVTVGSDDNGTNLFTTAGNSLTLAVGTPGTYAIGGGIAPYSSTSGNASVVTAEVSGGVALKLTPIAAGTTQVTVYDGGGNSVTIGVTVTATATGAIEVRPNGAGGTFLVGEDSIEIFKLNIFGGTPPYRVFTSDQRLSSVSIPADSSVLSVGLGSNGNRCFTPFDSSGVRVPFGTFEITITVLDSLGVAATSIMTLKDNGRGDGVTLPLCG